MTNKIRPKLCEKAFPSITLNILSHSIKKPVVFFLRQGFHFKKIFLCSKKLTCHLPNLLVVLYYLSSLFHPVKTNERYENDSREIICATEKKYL